MKVVTFIIFWLGLPFAALAEQQIVLDPGASATLTVGVPTIVQCKGSAPKPVICTCRSKQNGSVSLVHVSIYSGEVLGTLGDFGLFEPGFKACRNAIATEPACR